MDAICVGITTNGTRCKHRRVNIGDGTRCRVHHSTLESNGPNTTQIKELQYVQKKEKEDSMKRYNEEIVGLEEHALGLAVNRQHLALIEMRNRHTRDLAAMRHRHAIEIQGTGVDPDAPARARQRERNEERFRQRRALWDIMQQNRNAMRQNHAPAPPPVERGLHDFAADPQNVHTTEAVKQTKDIVARVRSIPVPEAYRWKAGFVGPTVGEIMSECKLTSHAGAQLFNKYVSRETIYEMEEAIYAKVLDSVWQYIKASPDKEDLCKILKQELEDNIGMCAQGNLSRICNVLAGYMEGIGSQESLSERLGRLLAPLMAVEDPLDRMHEAFKIMKENNVPYDEWDIWTGPLVDEDVEDNIDLNSLRRQFVEA